MHKLEKLQQHINSSNLSNFIINSMIINDELIFEIMPQTVSEFATFLKENRNCLFKMLVSICGVDYPHHERRFQVVYHFLSLHHNTRIRVKLNVSDDIYVPSLTKVFSAAGWFEREVFDMFGITFSGNDDLRRILTDYGFNGHPLRKDFPLTGEVEVRYDIEKRSVIYEKVKLTQEFRNFDFLSQWEGPNYTLPGDEKATK